jgi:hypothetical protein
MSKAAAGKDTIYIDVDDEITSIIDKVRSSGQKIVALVLPKRATVLQSIVNMKLLKRTADDADKHLVLITSEAGLLPLAGSVGLHVAPTPQSKPVIPPAPEALDDSPEDVDEPLDMGTANDAAEDSFDAEAAASRPIGELAAGSAVAAAPDDTIELDNSDNALAPSPAQPKVKKNKKLKIPNFDSFRNRLLLGAGVVALLVVAWIFAFIVMPHATVTIHTDTTTVASNLNLTLDTAAKTVSDDHKTVPAVQQSEQKTYTQTVPTTGQQNNGKTASGSITMSLCASKISQVKNVPSGTGVSQNGLTYITQEEASFHLNGGCSNGDFKFDSNGIDIVAIKGGAAYNTGSNTSFNVSGRSDVDATGSASGGTDDITKVVSQADIDAAKAKIAAQDTSTIKRDLEEGLDAKGLQPVAATFVAGDPQLTPSAAVGDATDTLTVTEGITYTMLGVKPADLKTVVDANVELQIDKGKQVILSDGVKDANFNVQNQNSPTSFVVAMSTKSVAGPDIDTAAIQKQVAGKKAGDIKSMLKDIPGVTGVDVKYGPFWVSSTPKNTSKITVQVDKANTGKS